MLRLVLVMLLALFQPAQEQDAGQQRLTLDAPEGWRGERIEMPPAFAPDMKVKGVEEIRFAPGMFHADSESFFSYVFAMQLDTEPPLTKDVLERELLEYYRGLANAVLEQTDVQVGAESFTLKLEEVKQSDSDQQPAVAAYRAELKWLEPFTTKKPQTLNLEIHGWTSGDPKQQYLFVIASPQQSTAEIWSQMREIRDAFFRQYK